VTVLGKGFAPLNPKPCSSPTLHSTTTPSADRCQANSHANCSSLLNSGRLPPQASRCRTARKLGSGVRERRGGRHGEEEEGHRLEEGRHLRTHDGFDYMQQLPKIGVSGVGGSFVLTTLPKPEKLRADVKGNLLFSWRAAVRAKCQNRWRPYRVCCISKFR
jgi:hypothetical protein